MTLQFTLETTEKLALRNPETTELGKKIVRSGLLLMENIGYEHFTFKKLAENIQTTEASIYRYFENKHKLLLYYLSWYWNITRLTAISMFQEQTKSYSIGYRCNVVIIGKASLSRSAKIA